MKNYTNLLEETLEAWQGARIGVIRELQNIPADKYDFRPAKGVRSVRELAIHILEVAMMMTGELTRPDTNFRRAPWPKLLDQYAAPAYRLKAKKEILDFLAKQLEEGIKKFHDAGELHMLQFIQRFDGKPGTRLAWLHHGIDQEEYHRGQLTVYARLLGLEPALTKLIKGS
jgi:uncharacterized damage-inducible protein DinB